MKSLLNVGGASKDSPIPVRYAGWRHDLLDVNARFGADVVMDARQMAQRMAAESYDAVYASHVLEHFYPHDLPAVLRGMLHVLKADGFVEVRVPDMAAVFEVVAQRKLDIEDVLYTSAAGPISVRDVVYGFGREIAESGNDHFAHKNGFTPRSLERALRASGFAAVMMRSAELELTALASRRDADRSELERMLARPDEFFIPGR